jgi:hypothetical protein
VTAVLPDFLSEDPKAIEAFEKWLLRRRGQMRRRMGGSWLE